MMDIQLLLTLIAGHYLADYGLQSRYVAENKGKIFIMPDAFHALTAHAAIHGLVIGLLAGSFNAGLSVAITHWVIDFSRSSEWLMKKLSIKRDRTFSIHIDQVLHVLMIILVTWRLS